MKDLRMDGGRPKENSGGIDGGDGAEVEDRIELKKKEVKGKRPWTKEIWRKSERMDR